MTESALYPRPSTAIGKTLVAFVDSMPCCAALLDTSLQCLVANEAAQKLLSPDSSEIVGSHCPQHAYAPCANPENDCQVRRVTNAGQRYEHEVHDEIRQRWYKVVISPTDLCDDNGEKLLLYSAFDISHERQARQTAEQDLEFQRAINEILHLSLSHDKLDHILEKILVRVTSIPWLALEARGVVMLRDEHDGSLHMVAQHKVDSFIVKNCQRIKPGVCLCGRAFQSSQVVYADSIDERHDIRQDHMEPHGHYCIPIKMAETTVGVFTLYLKPGHKREQREVNFLNVVADIIAGVVERARILNSLAHADRMASVGILAAGVAHEINNPLTYILFNLQELEQELAPGSLTARSELHAFAKEALNGAIRVRDIARDLKTFSRNDEDRLEQVDLVDVVGSAISMVHNELKYRARLVNELTVIPKVLANSGRLAQVFLNFLINAAHAVDEGDREHNVVKLRSWHDDNYAHVEICDTGCGISAEHLEHIFEPFFTTKPSGVGSGLGLAICKKIVESYQGSIGVASEPDRGTCFTVSLPLSLEPTSLFSDADEDNTNKENLPRSRILIVDDDAAVAQALRRVLADEHNIVVCYSGLSAQQLLDKDPYFDVVLCDLMMPNVTGMDLFLWVQKQHPQLCARFVFVSGGGFTTRARDFLHKLDNICIEKPVDVDKLRQGIRQVLLPARD